MFKRFIPLRNLPRFSNSNRSEGDLPTEILEFIFQYVLDDQDSCNSTRTLIAASRVSRKWRAIVQIMLYISVDPGSTFSMTKLSQSTHIDRTRVRSLAFTVPSSDTRYWTSLLDSHPNLSQLTIIHQNRDINPTQTLALNTLKYHPSVINITLLNPTLRQSWLLLQYLPRGLRFLSLPEDSWMPPPHQPSPGVSLYGLTLNRYPSPVARWLLNDSSLQCLTIVDMADLEGLGRRHPNLRSLRILGSLEPASAIVQLSQLLSLERLEVPDICGGTLRLDFLPRSLAYIRFSNSGTASALLDALSDPNTENLPALRTIFWDYSISQGQEQSLEVLREALRSACIASKINLRMHLREAPWRRFNDNEDGTYDTTFYRSCSEDLNAVQPPATAIFPARTIFALENAGHRLPFRYTGEAIINGSTKDIEGRNPQDRLRLVPKFRHESNSIEDQGNQ